MPYRKTFEVVGFSYEAGIHCLDCASKRFGYDVHTLADKCVDSEGNAPYPVFLGEATSNDDYCEDCFVLLEDA